VSDTTTTPTQKGDRRMTIGLILVSVTFAAIAQVTLKMGMNQVTDANGGQLALTGESLKQILTTLLVWVGLGISGSTTAPGWSRAWDYACGTARSEIVCPSQRSWDELVCRSWK